MATRQYGHRRGRDGRVEVVETTPPRAMRGCTEHSEGTVRIGLGSRLLGAALDRIGR
jgi:hypothetical protein